MHKVIFYNMGNGDTSQIVLENKKRLLSDFCHRADDELISLRSASTAGCQLILRGDPLNTTVRQCGARWHR